MTLSTGQRLLLPVRQYYVQRRLRQPPWKQGKKPVPYSDLA